MKIMANVVVVLHYNSSSGWMSIVPFLIKQLRSSLKFYTHTLFL